MKLASILYETTGELVKLVLKLAPRPTDSFAVIGDSVNFSVILTGDIKCILLRSKLIARVRSQKAII